MLRIRRLLLLMLHRRHTAFRCPGSSCRTAAGTAFRRPGSSCCTAADAPHFAAPAPHAAPPPVPHFAAPAPHAAPPPAPHFAAPAPHAPPAPATHFAAPGATPQAPPGAPHFAPPGTAPHFTHLVRNHILQAQTQASSSPAGHETRCGEAARIGIAHSTRSWWTGSAPLRPPVLLGSCGLASSLRGGALTPSANLCRLHAHAVRLLYEQNLQAPSWISVNRETRCRPARARRGRRPITPGPAASDWTRCLPPTRAPSH